LSPSPQSAVFDDDPSALPTWKQEVNARLMAHRTRRTPGSEAQAALPGMEPSSRAPRGASVAARVAERYSKAPSYREMLAAEAANAARAAEAAAKAAQMAHEAAQAVNEVLWAELEDESDAADPKPEAPQPFAVAPEPAPKLVEYRVDPGSLPEARRHSLPQTSQNRARSAENGIPAANQVANQVVDPLEDALVAPAQPLPVRILEFPRELVAARKARPRHAEGPLRESASEPERSQLRIFEVEPEAISHEAQPARAAEVPVLPEWHSIRLDAEPSARRRPAVMAREGQQDESHGRILGRSSTHSAGPHRRGSKRETGQPRSHFLDTPQLYVASMEDRLMAGIVDIALVLIGFLLFVLTFVACTAHPPTGKPAMMYAAIALVSIFALYQWLFFTFADSTPGMRYAKIALCTFDDENPTRRAMQMRIAALFLSAMPVGLGFLWALFDEDALGWHDRITRTYQRSYR
jgi:uncharacterized RDD family membrane protein YckC